MINTTALNKVDWDSTEQKGALEEQDIIYKHTLGFSVTPQV